MSSHPVRIDTPASIPLAVIRRQVRQSELARVVPECCGLVWNEVRAQKARGGRHVAIYWDEGIRLEVGVEIEGEFTERGGIVRSATPAGKVALAAHFGPYGNLGRTHAAVVDWVHANGCRLAGPSWEIYGHWLPEWDEDPSKIRTDVFYLLASV